MKINNLRKEVLLCFSRVSWDEAGQRGHSQTIFTPSLDWVSHIFAFRGDFHHCLVSELTRCRPQADSSAQQSQPARVVWTKLSASLESLIEVWSLHGGRFSVWPRINDFTGHPKLQPEPVTQSPETPTYVFKTIPLRNKNYFLKSEYKNAEWENSQGRMVLNSHWPEMPDSFSQIPTKTPVKTRQVKTQKPLHKLHLIWC